MELSTEVTQCSAFPLGKVARCCAHWRGIVTDEVRPPSVGVTAAAAASAPLCKVLALATKCGSRLPCVRGGGKTEGFD